MASTASASTQQKPQETREEQQRNPPLGYDVQDYIGFKFEFATAKGVQGRFTVSERSCQLYGVLHGGISAFLAEDLARLGAMIASNWKKIDGVKLSVNHLRAIPVGQEVIASATPLMVGNRIQVWDVKFSTLKPKDTSNDTSPTELSVVSRVTLIAGGLPSEGSSQKDMFEQYSKL
ncbi:hypothetical protein O6H91_12G008100 [Diphasiastrum complanatum]|uniref:Uncharacterized protein n=1 Tax=Diphasiastrum complanatum TaxID=34168 RepID=A0ACC2BZ35_DIPCM|nr:hypothetical protein O6H91_12G008100 [Diphasiastrum complanatum]